MSDILGFVLEAARGRMRWQTRRWRKVVRWVVRRGGVGLGKGGGGGWLALLICKTANLRTLCLPALSSSFSTFSTTAFSSYGGPTRSFSLLPAPLSFSISIYVSIYLSRSAHFGSTSLPSSRALLGPCKHAHQSTLSPSRSCHSLPSHLPAFPHPCGTSRKLYVPTLATLNAGLARDNPRPPPPPSTAAATPRVARRPTHLRHPTACSLFSSRRRSSRIHNQLTNTQVA